MEHVNFNKPDYCYLFTDGACNNPSRGKGAWAYLIIRNLKEIHKETGVEQDTTSNRMEMTAVNKGLKTCLDLGAKKVIWISDSRYSLDGLGSWTKKWISYDWKKTVNQGPGKLKNIDLWQEMVALALQLDVLEMYWTKSHTDNIYNNQVDFMCSQYIPKLFPVAILNKSPSPFKAKKLYDLEHSHYDGTYAKPKPAGSKKKDSSKKEPSVKHLELSTTKLNAWITRAVQMGTSLESAQKEWNDYARHYNKTHSTTHTIRSL